MHSFKLFKNHSRQYLKISFFLFSFLMLFCLGFNNLYAATYYVCTTGNDNNPGTEAKPFKTLQRAHTAVSAGDTVIVEDGTYTEYGSGTYNANLDISKQGTASNWITFKARNKHQAIIDGVNYDDVFINIRLNRTCAFIRIEGFTIRRAKQTGIRAISDTVSDEYARDIEIINNRIHDIGQIVVDHTYGISGIKTDALTRRVLIEGNTIYDIGRLPGGNYSDGAQGRDFRHDHGWYAQGKGHIFRNNHVYNCKAGWGIKIDGHYAHEELVPSEFSHIIENNFFAQLPNQGVAGGWIRPYNNRNTTDRYGEMKYPKYLLDGNYFYGDPSGYGWPVRLTPRVTYRYAGSTLKDNVCSAPELYEPSSENEGNIIDINNTTNAPESIFPNAPESIDISDPLTPPSITELTIN